MSLRFVCIIMLLTPLISDQQSRNEIVNSVGMKLRLISAGSFWMGGSLENEMPVHRVTIARPFYIGVHEVTQEQYMTVMKKKPIEYTGPDIPAGVTWNEAAEFCRR